jgi:hypothetical protein
LGEQSGLNKKITVVAILVLMSVAAALMPFEAVSAQSGLGVTIVKITPDDLTGAVGSTVNLQGTIFTSNGSYQVSFNNQVVDTGRSQGYYVNSTFPVPEFPSGNYPIVLRDTNINVNNSAQFTIVINYEISASPSTMQEGGTVNLNVRVTGSTVGTAYGAVVTVALPSPLGTKFSKTVTLAAANQKGTASALVPFPDSSFQPSGSTIDYAGTYSIYFNQSLPLAQNTFTVNFLDKTSYHRGDTVVIEAPGYQPNQAATISVSNAKTGIVFDSKSVTASADGKISTTWVVSNNAPIGDCLLKISADGVQKQIQDSQTFTVFGYTVKVQARNLAGNTVPDVSVKALDVLSNIVYNATTGSDGTASLTLEKGDYALTAFWNDVNVGTSNITVSGTGTFAITCQLTNLKVTVKNINGLAMPFVDINVDYKYQTATSGFKTGTVTGQTGQSGSCTFTSMLTGASFTVKALLYGQVFNSNNTLSSLPSQSTSEIVITCPTENINLNVVGFNQEAIPNARVELVELTTGLFYSVTTDSTGAASSQVTFGMYRARTYKDNILINETNIEAFSQSLKQIHCTLYGIEVKVSVVDFFGNPISNVNVTLNGPSTETFSAVTKSDGTATFSNVIGGNMQIIAKTSGNPDGYQAIKVTVNEPTTVQVKIGKYVALGPMLIQASTLIAVIIIIVAVVVLALVEIFLRRRNKRAAAA